MAIKNDKFSKFRGYISILSGGVSPEDSSREGDLSYYQNNLNLQRNSSRALRTDFLMAQEFTEGGLYVSGNDLAKVSGILNFAQAITHRLMTYRGTMPGDINFGIPWTNYLGKTYNNKSLVIADLTEEVENEVFKDDRTQEIRSINIEFLNPNVVKVDVTLVPVYTNFSGVVELTITSGE